MSIYITHARATDGTKRAATEIKKHVKREKVQPAIDYENFEMPDTEIMFTPAHKQKLVEIWDSISNKSASAAQLVLDPHVYPMQHPETFFLFDQPAMSPEHQEMYTDLLENADMFGSGDYADVYEIPNSNRLLRVYRSKFNIYGNKAGLTQFFLELLCFAFLENKNAWYVPRIHSYGMLKGLFFTVVENAGEPAPKKPNGRLDLTTEQAEQKDKILNLLSGRGMYLFDGEKSDNWRVRPDGQVSIIDLNGLQFTDYS